MLFHIRASWLFASSMVAAAAVLLTGALFVRNEPASASPLSASVTVTAATAKGTPRSDDYVFKRFVSQDTWQYLKADARALGLSRLYAADTRSPFMFGPNDGIWYIGTYGRSCLVSIGYPLAYSELGIREAPKLSVQVFNRYGESSYLDENNAVAYKAVAKFVARSATHCR